MRLAVIGFLLVLAGPLSAGASEAPQRWSVRLNGRVVEAYSYSQSRPEAECTVNRIGGVKREVLVRSVGPTVIRVAEVGTRVSYRPASLAHVSVRTIPGAGWWSETRTCRGDPIERRSGTCAAKPASTRVVRAAFRWSGTNRIAFRSRAPAAFELCGADRLVSPDAWLHVAQGRVDELVLTTGRRKTVSAHAQATRGGNIVEERNLTVGQSLRVVWTLRFRRLG